MSAKIINIQSRLQVKRDQLITAKMAQLQPAFDRADRNIFKAHNQVQCVKEILEDEGSDSAKLAEIRFIIYEQGISHA
jgi:hypothetical protein